MARSAPRMGPASISSCRLQTPHAFRRSSTCCRASSPERIYCWCSMAPPTTAAASCEFPTMLHCCSCVTLLFLPPYAPELNPKENLWEEIREKIFKNYALKSMDAVRQKLKEAVLYIERNPKIVKSITSFPYIAKSF